MFEEYPDYLSVTDCCEILGVGNHTIYNLINEGKLTARRVGEKMWRISKISLALYVLRSSGIDIPKEKINEYA